MYRVYLGKTMVPIAPAKITLRTVDRNKTLDLINGKEINMLSDAGLSDIEFELLLPNTKYPFAEYKSGFQDASYYIKIIEKLKTDKTPFQFIVTRATPGGRPLYCTNIRVSMEDFTIVENAENGLDVTVAVKLKQFREYGTKSLKTANGKITIANPKRNSDTSPAPKNTAKKYTVVAGDCLWTIAKMFYGDGRQWEKIYKANTAVCGKPYTKNGVVYSLIHPGDVLTIPV